jgi:uncharacterized metal-binding protein YceD (DUF177 family)
MAKQSEDQAKICFSDLNPKKVHDFDFRPTPEIIQKLVTELELLGLSKVRFHGQLRAVGRKGWELTAHCGARVIQPCVVSLDPVSTRIDVTVERKFIPLSDPAFDNDGKDEEIEMDQDDSIEPLEEGVDLLTILTESLALELPAYPRSKGAVLKTSTFSADGTVPMSDEDAKPFAGLAALRAKLEK